MYTREYPGHLQHECTHVSIPYTSASSARGHHRQPQHADPHRPVHSNMTTHHELSTGGRLVLLRKSSPTKSSMRGTYCAAESIPLSCQFPLYFNQASKAQINIYSISTSNFPPHSHTHTHTHSPLHFGWVECTLHCRQLSRSWLSPATTLGATSICSSALPRSSRWLRSTSQCTFWCRTVKRCACSEPDAPPASTPTVDISTRPGVLHLLAQWFLKAEARSTRRGGRRDGRGRGRGRALSCLVSSRERGGVSSGQSDLSERWCGVRGHGEGAAGG
jgi:hypothetical protein